MIHCNQCGANSEDPKTEYDEVNDEQYDLCPRCLSDDFITFDPDAESDDNYEDRAHRAFYSKYL